MSSINFDSHLAALKDRFAETPDSIILKADVLREGLRYTRELSEIAQWAIPSGAFLSREDVPEGEESAEYVLGVPNQIILGDDTRINTELDRNSPYTVRKDGEARHVLCRHETAVAAVSFPRRALFTETLSDGSAVFDALGQRAEGCVALAHSIFCEYAKNNDQCAFCFLGNAMAGMTLADISAEDLPTPTQSIEACEVAARAGMNIIHIVVSGGAFVNTSLEAKSYAKTIRKLREAVGPKPRITAVCQAFDEQGWLLLKDAGADRVQPNLEVWDEALWREIVPGKAKALGKREWLKRLESAVDIFGVGEVATNFVAGAELLSRNFGGLEDVFETHLEGYAFLLSHGIVPIFGFLTKARGTRYENVELPPTEFYLSLGWERTKLMEEFGMYNRYRGGIDSDFSCYKCVTHKTCQDYPRLLKLNTQHAAR
ncbi:MAG: hypothetical protein Kow0099_09350 [Candidatus Abyssubacteria bacterium]